MNTIVRYDEEGNIISSDVIGDNDSIKYVKPPKEGAKAYKKVKENNDKMSKLTNELGGFYFMLYYDNKLFDGCIDEKHICRLIYLATFLDYDSNRLVERQGRSNVTLTEKDIKAKLGLDKKTYKTFKDDVVGEGIVSFEDDGIHLSTHYFIKGKAPHKCSFSRVYVKTVRQLYEQVQPRQHKTLSYFFKLLPYCDYEYNVITSCPDTDEAMEHRMTREDIAELLEMDFNAFKKLEKALENLQVDLFGETYCVMGSVTVKCGGKKRMFYVVNPLIFNSGNEFDKLHNVWTQMLKM